MFESIDSTTALALLTLVSTVAMNLIGFGKIIGTVNVKMTDHDKHHIRH